MHQEKRHREAEREVSQWGDHTYMNSLTAAFAFSMIADGTFRCGDDF